MSGRYQLTSARYSLEPRGVKRMRREIRHVSATALELEALQRLEEGCAELADLERLSTLADLAGLPWGTLFPEWANSRGRP